MPTKIRTVVRITAPGKVIRRYVRARLVVYDDRGPADMTNTLLNSSENRAPIAALLAVRARVFNLGRD